MDFSSATTVNRELSSETCIAVPNRIVWILWLFPVRAEREMRDHNWTKKADKLGVSIRKFTSEKADKLIYMVTARLGCLKNYTSTITTNKRTVITCRVCLFEKKN